MPDLLPFFIVIFAALLFSAIFKRLHLPFVLALIVAGMAIGPHGLKLFEPNQTIEFLGELGLIMLMFMAGLETKLSSFKKVGNKALVLAVLNGLLPLGAGLAIGWLFGYPWTVSILLGIIFVSTSIAIVVPSIEMSGLLKKDLGKIIVSAAIIEDVLSLIALSIFTQQVSPGTSMPLPVFYLLILLLILVLRYLVPRLKNLFIKRHWFSGSASHSLFKQEIMFVMVFMLGMVILFDYIGLHPIIAGFFTGLVLSELLESELLHDRLLTFSYGFFVPIFFVLMGAKADLSVFSQGQAVWTLMLVIITGSLASKIFSGFLGGRILGYNLKTSFFIGMTSVPQLSTTLAVAYTGYELGILNDKLVMAMIGLSIVSAVLGPLNVSLLGKKVKH